MPVDTLRFSKQLQDRGRFSAEQADALAETIGAVSTETLATKGDIAAIRAEISELRSELKAEISELPNSRPRSRSCGLNSRPTSPS